MKAKNLRIGNYVNVFGVKIGTVKKLSIHKKIIDCTPIKITEEWLLNFGFDKALNGWWDETENYSLYKGWFRIGTEDIIKCKYVHELQNLYFALTGKELKHEYRIQKL